jgi:hypothetical protein
VAIKVSCCEFTVSPPSRKAVGCVRSRDGVEMTEEDPVRVRRIKLGSGLPALLFGIPVQMQRPCLWFLIWHAATVESRTARVLCRVANYLLKWVTRRGRSAPPRYARAEFRASARGSQAEYTYLWLEITRRDSIPQTSLGAS